MTFEIETKERLANLENLLRKVLETWRVEDPKNPNEYLTLNENEDVS